MRLELPPDLGKDELEDWKRHPISEWLRGELSDAHPKAGWRHIGPDDLHRLYRMQGRAEVIDALTELLRK